MVLLYSGDSDKTRSKENCLRLNMGESVRQEESPSTKLLPVAKVCLGTASRSRHCGTSLRRSILHVSCAGTILIPAHCVASLLVVRDGRIELPTSVWKTDVLPLN